MIRPKYTIANLLMLTIIVAMAATIYRNRVRIEDLEAQLARHEAVRAQTLQVRRRQLELRAASQSMQPELEMAALYRLTGFGDSPEHRKSGTVARDATAWQSGLEITMPVGYRRSVARVRNAQLRLSREQAILAQLELELDHTTPNSSGPVRMTTK